MITGISDRGVFTSLRERGAHVRTGDLRVRYLANVGSNSTPAVPQVAYSISRKVGNAVTRNRIRRRLRSLFTEYLGEHPEVLSAALVIVLPGARDRTYAELEEQVLKLFRKIENSTESAQ